jgi:hypothetical protein
MRRYLVALHVVALALAVTSQSQKNQREATALLRADARATGVVSLGPEIPTFFLARDVPLAQRSRVDAGWLHTTIAELENRGKVANRFLAFSSDRSAAEIALAAEGLMCDAPAVLDGIWRCERPALALGVEAPWSGRS